MLLGAFKARFTHGVLVISAPESRDSHDDWDPATQIVHAGQDSLYVGVMDSASGIVSVTCVENEPVEGDLSALFSGRIALPSARLRFYDPDENISMTVPVEKGDASIAIYADDEEEPSELLVHLT